MFTYQSFENHIYQLFHAVIGQNINIPEHIKISLGIKDTTVIRVDGDIGKRHDAKTDVLVELKDGIKLKLSLKKGNAHYYGNWYTHQRLLEEFDGNSLNRLSERTTLWANNWIKNPNSSFFIGVSINFGYRTGNTFINFNDVYSREDIRTIVQGFDKNSDLSANLLLNTDTNINNIDDIFKSCHLFTNELLDELFEDIKIIFRPVNPHTEGSNRGKQIYTKYVPNIVFDRPTVLSTKEDLIRFGRYVNIVLPENFKLNHNLHIKYLRKQYNVIINVKD